MFCVNDQESLGWHSPGIEKYIQMPKIPPGCWEEPPPLTIRHTGKICWGFLGPSCGENCLSVEIKCIGAASHFPEERSWSVQHKQTLSHYESFQSCGSSCHKANSAADLRWSPLCQFLFRLRRWWKYHSQTIVGLLCTQLYFLFSSLQPLWIEVAAGLPCPGAASPDPCSSWHRSQGTQPRAVTHHYCPPSVHFRA